MKERSIKELLEVMLNNQNAFTGGLCSWAGNILRLRYISAEEFNILDRYITQNRPSIWSSVSAFNSRHSSYYWRRYDIKPRIKWLKKHIKKTI